MTIPQPPSPTPTTHSSLISTLSSFYHTLIDLDYLHSDEVQFPPHTGPNKIPLASAALQSANLTQGAEQLLHLLPYILPNRLSKLFYGEARITLDSKPLSYLSNGEGEETSLYDARCFGYGDDGEVMLPGWAVQIFGANNSSESIVVYDTRTKKIFQLSIYSPTSHELTAAATSPDALIGTWTQNLLTLDWIPWRNDDELWGMATLDSEEESRLHDPEKWRQQLIATNGPTTLNDLDGNPIGTLPTAHQRFTWDIANARESHNRWWAKRLVYENAGWPGALNRESLRTRIRDFERERFEAMDSARPIGNDEEEAENEFYRRAAGAHGV